VSHKQSNLALASRMACRSPACPMKLWVLLLLWGLGQSAFARGESVEVRKIKYERRLLGQYEMTLQVIGEGENWLGCRKLTILGGYNFWRWKVRVRTPSSPTWAGHNVALERLEAIDVPFFLSIVGEGLLPKGQCVFVSEGLVSYYTNNGRFSIMSFYRNS
jgi:hypothetical protein